MVLALPEQFGGVQEPTEAVIMLLQPSFEFDLRDRITTRADPNQFARLEDPTIYQQAEGNAPTFYEVYWDNEWICDFDSTMSPNVFMKVFFEGFYDAYAQEKVSFTPPEETQREDKLEKQLKKAKKLPDSTPEEQLSKQAITDTIEDKKKEREKRKKLLEKK